MAAQTFAQLRTRLDTWLHDSTDNVFTSAEKDEFMTTAFADPDVFKIVDDRSLTSTLNGYQYTIPSTFQGIIEVLVDNSVDGFGDLLDKSAWKEINGVLYIAHKDKGIPSGKTIILRGKQPITSSGTVPDELQNYVLHLAMIEAYSMIVNLLAVRFVKNDITMTEALQALNRHEAAASKSKRGLTNRTPVDW